MHHCMYCDRVMPRAGTRACMAPLRHVSSSARAGSRGPLQRQRLCEARHQCEAATVHRAHAAPGRAPQAPQGAVDHDGAD